MYKPVTIYTKIALAAILENIRGEEIKTQSIGPIPPDLLQTRRGCFVSLHLKDGSLRGCIGTIEPFEKCLVDEISRNAISAAFHDTRFNPVTAEEINNIELSVDVLTVPEPIKDMNDLDPEIYGVIVTDNKYNRAVLLPSIPSIDTVEKQIEILKRKAGLSKVSNDKLTFYRFTSNRYH
jgi:AmmeMemoRadiSam system protein A